MKTIDLKMLNNEVYLTRNKTNLRLSLLAHIRNAIAHGNVVEHDKKVLITDYSKSNTASFSARGSIDIDVIKKNTIILKRIEL